MLRRIAVGLTKLAKRRRTGLACIPILLLTVCGEYPDSAESSKDVYDLDQNTDYISARGLPMEGLDSLARLSMLRSIDFMRGWGSAESVLTDQGLQKIEQLHLSSLERLVLGRCPAITDEGLLHISAILTLRNLSLAHNSQITNEGLRHISSMPALYGLSLHGCTSITDEGIAHLVELSNLEVLDLRGCAISDDGMLMLKKLQKLSWIRLDNNVASREVFAQLRSALPDCNISLQ